jgi:hypothetical protein
MRSCASSARSWSDRLNASARILFKVVPDMSNSMTKCAEHIAYKGILLSHHRTERIGVA